MVNPMTAAFVTDSYVSNQSGGRILVTPIGTVGPEERRAPLPV
jgi:hypothetical protein